MLKIKFVFNTRPLTWITLIENIYDLYTCALSYITINLCKMRFIKTYFVPCKTIYFNIGYNHWLKLPNCLPSSLKFLKSPLYNCNMTMNETTFSLLNELKYFQPSDSLNQIISLPESLEFLDFTWDSTFDQQISLPSLIYYVHFGHSFNQKITFSDSTNNLKYLIFGSDYNQPLKLLPSVKVLVLGHFFNQKIVLPDKLEYLKLGHCFQHNVIIPQTLKFLYLNTEHDQILDNLPNTLETLCIHNNYKNPLSNLPNYLKNLKLYNTLKMFPIALVHRNEKIYHGYSLGELPNTIEHIEIEGKPIIIFHSLTASNGTVRKYLSSYPVQNTQ